MLSFFKDWQAILAAGTLLLGLVVWVVRLDARVQVTERDDVRVMGTLREISKELRGIEATLAVINTKLEVYLEEDRELSSDRCTGVYAPGGRPTPGAE